MGVRDGVADYWENFEEELYESFINSNIKIPISLQPHGINLFYFKLRLFDLTDFIV